MTGLDTNVLVALASSTHPRHAQAFNTLEQKLEEGEEIALGLLIAAEFLHVITDPKRITPPSRMGAFEYRQAENRESLLFQGILARASAALILIIASYAIHIGFLMARLFWAKGRNLL